MRPQLQNSGFAGEYKLCLNQLATLCVHNYRIPALLGNVSCALISWRICTSTIAEGLAEPQSVAWVLYLPLRLSVIFRIGDLVLTLYSPRLSGGPPSSAYRTFVAKVVFSFSASTAPEGIANYVRRSPLKLAPTRGFQLERGDALLVQTSLHEPSELGSSVLG